MRVFVFKAGTVFCVFLLALLIAVAPVAALVYQRHKHTINLVVFPETADSSIRDTVRTVRGFNVRHWVHDGMSFWAVSDLNSADLGAFASGAQEW